nr:hypothetical protein [Tanacetum cinerariifolium]
WVSDEESEAPEEAPPSPDYVPGLEHPPSPDYVPDYVPEPEYPMYLAPSDAEAPIKDQPLPDDASPTALSPVFVTDSDLKEDLEEDPTEYPTEREEDDDNDDEEEEEDEEEGGHLAPADSTALHTIDLVSSAKDTKAFKMDESTPTPPSPRSRRAKISIRPQTPMSAAGKALIVEFEVGESSSAATARKAKHTLARRVDYGFVDTVDASIHAYESRAMTTVEEVNKRVTDLASTQRQDAQELYKMSPKKRTTKTTTTAPLTNAAIEALIAQGVADALAEIEANKTSRNDDDNHNSGTRSRRTERSARECTYSDFLKCQPINFKGMLRKTLKKMMIAKYYPRGETKKLKIELWNLKVKGTDVLRYNQRFQELALMFSRMFLEEFDECAPKCTNYKRTGHLAWDCKNHPAIANNQRAPGANNRGVTCFECGAQGRSKRDYPKLKNNNGGNQARNSGAITRAYAVRNVGKNPDANVVMNHGYDVELADGKIIRVNTIIRGCTINILNHPFNIDIMPVELGSFDVIIGMDWILEKLDHMVKDFRLFKNNSGMTTRIWSEDDKRRSKEFMEVIEHRLKLRRIFRSLESFVGGRLRDVDYKLI